VGIESINPKALARINKGFNRVDDFARIIRKVQSYGIRVGCGFVLGLDGEDRDFYKRMLAFLEATKITYVTPTYATYVPGTRAYQMMQEAGRILTDDLRLYDGLHPMVEPDGMTLDELNEGLRWFIKRFFGMGSILKRLPDRWWRRPDDLLTHLAVNLWFRSWYWMLVQRHGPRGVYLIDHPEMFERAICMRYRRHWLWDATRSLFTRTSGVQTERAADPAHAEAAPDGPPVTTAS